MSIRDMLHGEVSFSPRVTEHNMRAKHTSAYEHSPPRGTLHAYNKKKETSSMLISLVSDNIVLLLYSPISCCDRDVGGRCLPLCAHVADAADAPANLPA